MRIFLYRSLVPVLACLALLACSRREEPIKTSAAAGPAYAAIARGKIDVEGGLINLSVARDGVIAEVSVKPGDRVRRGDLLGQLDARNATIGLRLAEVELKHARAELTALSSRLPLVRQTAQRWQDAAQAGVAEQQRAAEAGQESQRLEADIGIAQSTVELARQKVALARHEIELMQVRAPADADIVKVMVQPGSTVSTQDHQAAFVLLPHRPLIVHAEVNESYIGRIHPGMPALLSLESDPGRPALKAHVTLLSPVLETARLGDEQQVTRTLECTLQLDDDSMKAAQDLRIGQNVLVNFHD